MTLHHLRIKLPFALTLLFIFSSLHAQDPSGKLILSGWGSGGMTGYKDYPSGTWTPLSIKQCTDLAEYKGDVIAAQKGTVVRYDLVPVSVIDSLAGLGVYDVELWNDHLWVSCDSHPHVRVLDMSNNYTTLVTLDSNQFPYRPIDFKIHGHKAYFAMDTFVHVYDATSQNKLATITTPLTWWGAGTNTYLTPFRDKVLVDAEYVTAVPRLDITRIDTSNFTASQPQFIEGTWNFTDPVATETVVYTTDFDNHYLPAVDSVVFTFDTAWGRAVAFDAVSGAVFFGYQGAPIIYYQRTDSSISAGDTVPHAWGNDFNVALWVPDSGPQVIVCRKEGEFSVWPNPSSGTFQFESGFEGSARLISADGKSIEIGDVQIGVNDVQISDIAPGTYLLQLEGNSNELISQKILISN